ncbi:tetratricopeptide repeat protein [Mesorhizobium sp. AR07]|uniref:tetratricopeptide repeat protein n=1 Tax=Mesorhizobium sp. AR07 TaxID=2865838 RepID=UPI00215F34EA|nr:tetratricopeptide repeat protein [Mesorhizobium sp. AR07]
MASCKSAGMALAAIGLRTLILMKASPSWRLSAALAVCLALNAPTLAAEKDYAGCVGKDVEPDKRIAACTPIAEDKGEFYHNRMIAYFKRGIAWDDKRDYDRAIADYDQAVSLDPNEPEAYYNRGTTWFNKGDSDRAIIDFDQAINLNPQYTKSYLNRGTAWFKKGDDKHAIADFDKTISLDPSLADAF